MEPTGQAKAEGAEAPRARTNWAGNHTYGALDVMAPASATELADLMPSLRRVKAVGTRHAFNPIADTTGTQVDLRRLQSISLGPGPTEVTVGAGVTYGVLAPWLEARGLALHNLASLPHISVAGACATATHGSGSGNGCLSTAVVAFEWIDGRGELQRARRGDAVFNLACVHLGALGVVTALTLDVVPTYEIAQTVYENLSFTHLRHHLRDLFAAAYSVSLFTDWQHHRATQAWVKHRLDGYTPVQPPATFFGAARQQARLHPLPGVSAENCTEQMGLPGPWHERLPHFRLDYTPSAGAELQTEYFVPLEQGYEAVLAVEALRDLLTPHLLISELRTVAADDLAMSMACGRDALALHFTWKPDLAAVHAVLPRVEAALRPFAARPHWAKLFALPTEELRRVCPQVEAFGELAARYDPVMRFQNAFLEHYLGSRSPERAPAGPGTSSTVSSGAR